MGGRGVGGNAERTDAGGKTVVSDCRVVADSLGGRARRTTKTRKRRY